MTCEDAACANLSQTLPLLVLFEAQLFGILKSIDGGRDEDEEEDGEKERESKVSWRREAEILAVLAGQGAENALSLVLETVRCWNGCAWNFIF